MRTDALVLLALSISSNASPALRTRQQGSRRNIILGWTDGMGPNVLPMARQYTQVHENASVLAYSGYETPLEDDLIGKSRTGSLSSLITDSAAGATAVASGVKTLNGAVGVDGNGTAVGTVLEAAKAAGYLTAVITTSYTWDASPAAFNSHSKSRNDAGFIATQQVGLQHPLGFTTDIILGGGLCAYLPQSDPDSCRTDNRTILDEVRNSTNYTIILTASELASAQSLPLLGLFAPEDTAYAIDKPENTTQPGLLAMVDKALDLLFNATANSDQGFFLFYESEVTDSAQHDNDLIGTLSGALEISETATRVKEWVRRLGERGDDTLFFSTSDHETGGLGLGSSAELLPVPAPWGWNPLAISNATRSAYYTANAISDSANATAEDITSLVSSHLGLGNVTDSEIQALVNASGDADAIKGVLVESVNVRARVGWTTGGHTATDVDIYCFWESQEYCLQFRGSHENTELAGKMATFLGVDMDGVTSRIRDFNTSGPVVAAAT